MIVVPKNQEQFLGMANFMHQHAHVAGSFDTKFVGWAEENELKMCVAINAMLGKTAQIHVAMIDGYHFTPRLMLEAVFDFAFNVLQRELLIGIVNSKNEKALKYDQHLGFVEVHRLPGMHDDGGDLVMLTMNREQCKYLEKKEAA